MLRRKPLRERNSFSFHNHAPYFNFAEVRKEIKLVSEFALLLREDDPNYSKSAPLKIKPIKKVSRILSAY